MRILLLLFVVAFSTQAFAKSVVQNDQKVPFSLEDILRIRLKSLNTNWISDNLIAFKNGTSGHVEKYDVVSNKNEILLNSAVLGDYNASSYMFSDDVKYVLIGYDTRSSFRHSTISRYVVYSLTEKKYIDVAEKSYLQYAGWVPRHNAIVYIKENNLYFLDQLSKDALSFPITESGVPGLIFNGICDWVYEEEILGTGTSFSISPDGNQMLFMNIDNRNVTEVQFMTYGKPGSLEDQYTTAVKIPYPKPGTVIGKYEIWHFNFTSKTSKMVAKHQFGKELTYGWRWITDNTASVLYTNRVQNESQAELCNLNKGSCIKLYEDKNTKGWANFDTPFVGKHGDQYLVRTRQPVAGKEYYHIHLVYLNGTRIVLTNGTFMVRKIIGWDQDRRMVYYESSEPDDPLSKQVYSVQESGGTKPFCLTCALTTPACKSGYVQLSKNFKHFIGFCRGPSPPTVSVWQNSQPLTQPIRILDESSEIRQLLSKHLRPDVKYMNIKVTNSVEADVALLLPPNMDTSGRKKYPLLIYVYGGPDNPQVSYNLKIDFSWYLTTNLSIIYGIIDGRGTGNKGTEMMYAVYRALGTAEMEDQITATRYLKNNLNFIDPKRVGIWGWSYGGYATAKILEEDSEGIFKCGVSVAPVSDWIYYNSAYTERYMGLPSENQKGYRAGSILFNVTNLRNKNFLLMHGTGDDNVHFQHAMQFAKVLQQNKILYEEQAYSDEAHGLVGVLPHVYYTMNRFWKNCFEL